MRGFSRLKERREDRKIEENEGEKKGGLIKIEKEEREGGGEERSICF